MSKNYDDNNPKAYYNDLYDAPPGVPREDDSGPSASAPLLPPPPPYTPYTPIIPLPSAPPPDHADSPYTPTIPLPSAPPSDHTDSPPASAATPLPYSPPASAATPLPYSPSASAATPLPYSPSASAATPLPYSPSVSAATPLPHSSGSPHINPNYGAIPVTSDADVSPQIPHRPMSFGSRWTNPPSGHPLRGYIPAMPHLPGFRMPHMPHMPHMPSMPHMPPMAVPPFFQYRSSDPSDHPSSYHHHHHHHHRRRRRHKRGKSCAKCCLYFFLFVLLSTMLSKLLVRFGLEPGDGEWGCWAGQGFEWDEIDDGIQFNSTRTKSFNYYHAGAISSAHLTIVRSTDPDTTAIQLLSKVTLSTRELSDRLTYALGVDSTTFAVSARLTTPDTLDWNECICIDVTLIIPQRWDGANRLAFDLHGWEVDLHDLVDSPDSGNGGLDFDIIDIRTTHRPLTIMGHLAARSILNLAASDSPVRSKGTLRSGDILTVKSSNAPLDLNSTFGRIVSLSTTNGRVRGRHEAKDTLRIETSNGPVDLLRASAPAVRIKTTNGGIACREVRVGRVVEVATSNGGVDLEVGWLGAEPQGAEGVKVLVRTSNEPAKVLLPDSFKGSFIVATTQDTATIGYATDPFNSSDSLEPHPRSYPPAYPGTPPKPLASGELHYNVSRSNMKQGWKGRNEDDLYRGEIDVKTKNAKASVWFVREVSEEEESVS